MVEAGPLPWLESRPYSDLAGLPDLAYLPAATRTDRLVAVGAHDGLHPVGVAVVYLLGEGRARLWTFKIRDEYDQPDTRAKLLESLDAELRRVGCTIIDYAYSRELDRGVSLVAIPMDENPAFQPSGWSLGQPASVVLTYTERFGEAPWVNTRRPMRQDLEIFPWSELRSSDRERITTLLDDEPAFASLNPESSTEPYFPASSFGLRHNGQLAGWCITSRVKADTLQYGSFFVEPQLRLTEAPLVLMRAAIRSQFELKDQISSVVQTIPVGMTPILLLAQRKMAPWADKIEGLFVTCKKLTPLTDSTTGRDQ